VEQQITCAELFYRSERPEQLTDGEKERIKRTALMFVLKDMDGYHGYSTIP
jgi:hypothetical protein